MRRINQYWEDQYNVGACRLSESNRTGLSCHVQWRYEESAAAWQYAGNVTWNPETNHFLVEGLQPYTKYRVCPFQGFGYSRREFSEMI